MTDAIKDILQENDRRNATMFATFNPYTGEGSVGQRFVFSLPDFPIVEQWLPMSMSNEAMVKKLKKAGSVERFMKRELDISLDDDEYEETRIKVIEAFTRLRCRHDFPFWAATYVYVKNKEGGGDVLFRLTYPQRKFVERLEQLRLAGRPIRIVLLKARQWGGSTTSQLYMAWLQLMHRVGLNSLIVSQVKGASMKIKDMFRRMIDAYPLEMLHEIGEHYELNEPKLRRLGGSDETQRVPQRNCTISVGTAEEPDSVRSGDYSLVHLSEVGLWKSTQSKTPEDIVRSACSGVLYRPYTMIVYESTANGVGNFFYDEYTAAADPKKKSQFEALFVSWFDIELYRMAFDNNDEREKFARMLWEGREGQAPPSEREEAGRYLWWLWEKGATLEGIRWYIEERAKFSDHGQMASEYPTDDNEAFVNSGNRVFDKILVERMRPACQPPLAVGDVTGVEISGQDALEGLKFHKDEQGRLSVWDYPELPQQGDTDYVSDRYLTIVDVGGRSDKADWSVIAVFDRLYMMDNHGPSVVAQWYGHIDMDLLAWKAAQIAAWYDNSLLVIESNTLETHDRERILDGGDNSLYILNQIRDVYPNLYARAPSDAAIRQGIERQYGFHTNTVTKPKVINTLIRAVRDGLYTERDSKALDELINYERKQNGAYGAISGKHDDILMTRAIGLHICFHEMEAPELRPIGLQPKLSSGRIISEATM